MFFLISTLVWATVLHAAPILDAPLPPEREEKTEPMSPEKIENISIAQPKHHSTDLGAFVAKFNRDEYYYPYKQELQLHIGGTIGFVDSSDSHNLIYPLIGFDFVFPNEFSPKWEAGADLSFNNRGYVWFARRHISNEKGSFRPYLNYGVMQDLHPSEMFASFSDWDNYLVRLGAGLENMVKPPRSAVVELDLAVGTKDILLIFTYGAAWGF